MNFYSRQQCHLQSDWKSILSVSVKVWSQTGAVWCDTVLHGCPNFLKWAEEWNVTRNYFHTPFNVKLNKMVSKCFKVSMLNCHMWLSAYVWRLPLKWQPLSNTPLRHFTWKPGINVQNYTSSECVLQLQCWPGTQTGHVVGLVNEIAKNISKLQQHNQYNNIQWLSNSNVVQVQILH